MNEIDQRFRIRELEDENTALRDALSQLQKAPMRFDDLTGTENKILGLIYNSSGLITKRAVYDGIYWAAAGDGPDIKILDVYLCRIRKKMRSIGVEIETIWGDGWMMPPASKKILARRCGSQ